jgi:hypothetical protein
MVLFAVAPLLVVQASGLALTWDGPFRLPHQRHGGFGQRHW